MKRACLILGLCLIFTGIDRGHGGSPSLFLTEVDLFRIRKSISNQEEPFYSNYKILIGRADTALNESVEPFWMSDIARIKFGWCQNAQAPDDSLRDLTTKLEQQSDKARTLALAWLFTGNKYYAEAARNALISWATKGMLLNMYDLGIDFKSTSFSGMTSDGYCGVRPWNMALDSMWQCYGLINFADTYLILKNDEILLSTADDQMIRKFLLELTEAVNSGFHAWARWADAHSSSSAYTRYRSDNHLSWSLAGLIAGAVALGDGALAQYVLHGSAWKDSHAGTYANPSSIRSVIDLALESGTGTENEGRMYEEKILRDPPIGYSLFHLWAMSLVAIVAEKQYGEDLWNYKGSDGAGLREAYDRYSAYVLGERESPEPNRDGDLADKSWNFEFAYAAWPTQRFEEVISVQPRNKYLVQGIGPVTLIVGREFGYDDGRVEAPEFNPSSGKFLMPVNVKLFSSTPDATIRYTADGTAPTSRSDVYNEPFVIDSSAVLKALATKDGLENSSVSEVEFSIGEIFSNSNWHSEQIETQTGTFQISFDIVPSAASIDGVVGLGYEVADDYSDLGAIVQFYSDGLIRARNGDRYEADQAFRYEAGVRYGVRMCINVPGHTYSVFITPQHQSEITLATDYAFRRQQSAVPSISFLSIRTSVGSQGVSNVQLTPNIPIPPQRPTGLRIAIDYSN